MYLGSCVLTLDQVKIGNGVHETFDLLNDNERVGKIQIQTNYIEMVEADFHPTEEEIHENLDNPDEVPINMDLVETMATQTAEQIVIHNPQIDHQLRPSISRSNFSSLSIPMDPFANIEVSMTRNMEFQSTM